MRAANFAHAFGRTTGEPGEVETDYYVNDLARRRSMDDARTTCSPDPVQRFRAFAEEKDLVATASGGGLVWLHLSNPHGTSP